MDTTELLNLNVTQRNGDYVWLCSLWSLPVLIVGGLGVPFLFFYFECFYYFSFICLFLYYILFYFILVFYKYNNAC